MTSIPKISIIAAIGRRRELGKDGGLIWRISDDLKRFRRLTTGHPIIMGRKTFESIGCPLPDRINIVVTRDPAWYAEGVLVATTPDEGIALAKARDEEEAFVIGGAEIYRQCLPHTDRLYLTLVDAEDPDADTHFPEYAADFTKAVSKESHADSDLPYTYLTLDR